MILGVVLSMLSSGYRLSLGVGILDRFLSELENDRFLKNAKQRFDTI